MSDLDDMDDMHSKVFARATELGKTTHKGVDFNERVNLARQEMPEIAKGENRIVTVVRDDTVQRVAKSAAVLSFEKRVAEIHGAEKCSHIKAMSEARIRFPDEFAAYQAG